MVENKAVLISINKPHTDKIFSGDKRLEWRKKPLPEGQYYVYETKNKGGCGMVIGEMQIVGSIAIDTSGPLEVCLVNAGCVHPVTLKKYANNGTVYANFIKDARRYEVPKPLSEFVVEGDCDCLNCKSCAWLDKGNGFNVEDDCNLGYENVHRNKTLKPLFRPPQSWCYVEEVQYGSLE